MGHIAKFLAPYIMGLDPLEINTVNESLNIPFISGGGLIRSFISAIDIALWDIKGKVFEKPIARLLNESGRDSVKVYASGGSVVFSPNEIRTDIENILNDGYVAYKMRVGFQSWENDLKRVSEAREALGNKNELMIDAIMGTLPNAWDAKTAVNNLTDLAVFQPCWVEEPLNPEDYLGYQEIQAKTELPIALGESFCGLHEFMTYIDSGCVDIIQPDVTHCGGYTGALRIIRFAERHNIPVALHVWGSAISIMANLHLACAAPAVEWLEIPQVRLELMPNHKSLSGHDRVTGGCLREPVMPGLGLSISSDLKSKYTFVPGSGYRVPSSK